MSSKHPLVRSFDVWLATPEGLKASDVESLKLDQKQRRYLENRLYSAYMAGAKAQENINTSNECVEPKKFGEYLKTVLNND